MRLTAVVGTVVVVGWWAGTGQWPRFGGVVTVALPGGVVLPVPVLLIAAAQVATVATLVRPGGQRLLRCAVGSLLVPAFWAACLVGAASQILADILAGPVDPRPASLLLTAGPAAWGVAAFAVHTPAADRPRHAVPPLPILLGGVLFSVALAAARPEPRGPLHAVQSAFVAGLLAWMIADWGRGRPATMRRSLTGGLAAVVTVLPGADQVTPLTAAIGGAIGALLVWALPGAAARAGVGSSGRGWRTRGTEELWGAGLVAMHMWSMQVAAATTTSVIARVLALGVHTFAVTVLVGMLAYRLVVGRPEEFDEGVPTSTESRTVASVPSLPPGTGGRTCR